MSNKEEYANRYVNYSHVKRVAPRVSMICCTPHAEAVIVAAIKTCRAANGVPCIYDIEADAMTTGATKDLIGRVLKSGHTSILEHVQYTFDVSGMSLAARSQLFRFRHGSYTEQSKRTVTASQLGIVQPQTISLNAEATLLYNDVIRAAYFAYDRMVELGIPKEDARYAMPVSLETATVITYNARELFDVVFPSRLCFRAQWEVRAVCMQMYDICLRTLPSVFKLTGPKCHTGSCTEHEKCKRSREDVIQSTQTTPTEAV